MSTISLRLNKAEERLFKNYAFFNRVVNPSPVKSA